MKKTLKIISITFGALVCLYISLGCAYILITSNCFEKELAISKEELMGKTKEEVLKIAFEKSSKVSNGESLIISAITNFSKSSLYPFYYENVAQILENEDIMDSDKWGICYTDSYMIIMIQVDYWVLNFENNKVASVEKESYGKL